MLSSNKTQNSDILVPANPGPPGKMAIKMEREREPGNGLGLFLQSRPLHGERINGKRSMVWTMEWFEKRMHAFLYCQ